MVGRETINNQSITRNEGAMTNVEAAVGGTVPGSFSNMDGTRASGRRMRVWRVSLVCGIVSSLLYVAMNVLGALQWKDYNSVSQTISELAAIGAPSRPMWLRLGVLYQFLVIVFGIGVWASGRHSRALRVAGGLLIAYGALGLAAPFFPMHRRGALVLGESTFTDTMHKLLALATVLSMSLAIGFAAAALGRRFRIYSIATVVMLVVFGLLAGLDAPRIEANLPTPTVGVVERICVGAFLLWVVVLAAILLPRQGRQGAPAGVVRMTTHLDGLVTRGFEEVRAEFERNFVERGEIGAAVAAYWRGEKVVDLWGGRRAPTGEEPWNEDTMVAVNSTTKGLAALTIAVANSRGWIDYDAPVADTGPSSPRTAKPRSPCANSSVTKRDWFGSTSRSTLMISRISTMSLAHWPDRSRPGNRGRATATTR